MSEKIHFIGLCGAGMSAVARLCQEAGAQVTGSDEGVFPPVSDYIQKIGLRCAVGYRAENVPSAPDAIVVGKNTRLVAKTNPEVAVAYKNYADKIKSFPEMLASITNNQERLVVAGSYGKSTLTGLVAWILLHAGRDPGYFIGAIPKNMQYSSALGGGDLFLFEGDEYPSANWDQRSKFLHYKPHAVILTSACHDHVNVFPTLADYHQPFKELLSGLEKRSGHLVACLDEENAASFYQMFKGQKTSYGLKNADWCTEDISLGASTSFQLIGPSGGVGTIKTNQLGRHMIQNIVGAAAYLLGQNYVTFAEFFAAVEEFQGLSRRLDIKSLATSLAIYEGFGSSYEKARAAIVAIKEHFPDKRLAILFEPHAFTWRNRAAINSYKSVFEGAESAWLYAPPAQGAHTHDQLSLEEILAVATAYHGNVKMFARPDMPEMARNFNPNKDIVLILSSGGFDGGVNDFVTGAEQAFPVSR